MREPFSISLVAAMKQGIDHLNSVLLEQNYDRLLLLIVNHVALRIEKLILQKKFSFVKLYYFYRMCLVFFFKFSFLLL